MSVHLRKCRGVMSMAATWGTLWYAIFAVLAIAIGIVRPEEIDPGEGPIRVGAIMAGVGFLSGIAFGVLLSFAESRRPIRSVALGRAAIWGMLASAAFPLVTGRQVEVFVLCPIGAVLAVALVAIARKAERKSPGRPQRLGDVFSAYVLTSIRDVVNSPTESPA